MKMDIVRVNQCYRVPVWYDWMAKPLTGYRVEMQREDEDNGSNKHRKPMKSVKVPCKCYVKNPVGSEALFYAGMLDDFIKEASKHGYEVNVIDGRVPNPMNIKPCLDNIPAGLRYKQDEVIDKIITLDKGIINCTVGFGKCLKKDTPVLCYDGTTKVCQDVKVGDMLMGPDSTPREVIALENGVEPLYRIVPVKGEPFTVTGAHQLTVVISGNRSHNVLGRRINCGELFELTVDDYFKLHDYLKRTIKLVRASAIDFPRQSEEPPLDPYFLGVYLGDGHCCYNHKDRNPGLTLSDQEVIDYVLDYSASQGWPCRVQKQGSWASIFVNQAGRRLLQQETGYDDNPKAIKPRYLLGSREERLQLLAGLIDTDGYAVAGCMYEISTKFDQLSKDILFLARSLGFAAYSKLERKVCTNTGAAGMYHRITISGDCSIIPVKVVRKRVRPRAQIKNTQRVGFSIEPAGDGEYYGFQVTGDGRHLLGDFTITHNSFLMKNLCLIYPTARIVIVTAARELVKQIYDDLADLLGAAEVGLVRGGTPSTEEDKRVVVSTCASVCRCPLSTCDFLFFDEVHNIGFNRTFDNLIENLGPARCFGFTASPKRGDQALDAMKSLFGQVVATCSYQEATEHRMVTPMRAFMPLFTCSADIKVSADKTAAERANYWRNKERNRWIANQAADAAEAFPEDQMLITVKTLEHAIMLMQEPRLADWELIYSGSIPAAEKTIAVYSPDTAPKEIHARDIRDSSVCVYTLANYSGVWGYECGNRFVTLLDARRYLVYVDGGSPVADVVTLPVKIAGVDVTQFKRTKKQVSEQVAAFARGDIRRAIATSMIKEGGNFYQLSHIFRADGSTSEVINTQFPGRASRVLQTKPEAIIVDPYDNWNSWVRGRAEARKKVYKKHGWFTDI